MLRLVKSSSIASIQLDDRTKCTTGRIHFHGGEQYEGELNNKKPHGQGRLTLSDSSYYEGVYDDYGIADGVFHSSYGVEFKGKFIKERFGKGTITFPDGDCLTGEWGPEKSKWVLKVGTLSNQEGESIGKISSDASGLAVVESKGKKIYRSHQAHGFAIMWESFRAKNSKEIRALWIDAEGVLGFELEEDGKKFRNLRSSQLLMPIVKKEEVGRAKSKIQWIKFDFGAQLELNTETDTCELTFNCFTNISAKGLYEHDTSKLKIKGKLLSSKTGQVKEIGSFKLRHSNLKPLVICLNEQSFSDFESFFLALEALGYLRNSKKVQMISKPVEIKKSGATNTASSNLLKMMINVMGKKAEKEVRTEDTSTD